MTEYIKREQITVERLTCSHKKVKKIWEYGALAEIPTSSLMTRVLCIQLENDEVKKFEDNGNGQAEIDAEKFLQEI